MTYRGWSITEHPNEETANERWRATKRGMELRELRANTREMLESLIDREIQHLNELYESFNEPLSRRDR